MPHAPRTIAFLCELLHPPVTPDPAPVQRLHDTQFRSGDPTYRSFTVTHEGAVLSNPVQRPGAQSQAAFLQDRFRFVEELTGLTADEFASRVRSTSEPMAEARGLSAFVAQAVTVRMLVNPLGFDSGIEFVGAGLLGVEEELAEIGRPAGALGIRMVFTPRPDEPSAFGVRIESLPSDPRSLWIECQGTFPPLVVAGGLEAVEARVHETYEFTTRRVLPFLARFEESAR
ncbi:hypothetical protein [Engelhardtia mirabilis]|uniref:TIGR04255 family protein n=1 Tax=Engelhardtia mirabilis TaxID=2528011 RepID=A0A518BH90_9BACT|nr:hypothetical protein Pla133_13600 [Planctomycetes bacterium Pla133]QDV00619.1 hypothetical protein Pla86_13590 [Planctomycetes bacterium Pla86]